MLFIYLLAKDFPNIFSFKAHFNCTQSSLRDLKKLLSFSLAPWLVCGFYREPGITSVSAALQRVSERVSDVLVLV